MDELECHEFGGAFLAPPFLEAAVEACASNTCETGSCCSSSGVCEDYILGLSVTHDDCSDIFGGSYAGGLGCWGGTCNGGDRNGLGCSDDVMCPDGTCEGVPFDPPIYLPCPVCEIASGGNCQHFDDALESRPSDATLPGGARMADDFIPAGDLINTICVWGNYTEINANGNVIDCAELVSDSFEVSVYYPDAGGVPDIGNPAGSSFVTGANVAKARIPASLTDVDGVWVYAYQLTLDSPIQLNPDDPADQIYWLEVRNDTFDPVGDTCVWNWQVVDTQYNDYSSSGYEGGYFGLRTDDLAFCLDSDFTAPDPYLRQCCDCNEVCTLETKRDCDAALASFDVTQDVCSVCEPLPRAADNCLDVINTPPLSAQFELISFDNHCTTTDGPNPTPTELNPAGVTAANDLWYLYQAPVESEVLFSTCNAGLAAGGGIDTVIAVYLVDCDTPTCPTQSDHLSRLISGAAHDEDCNGRPDGSGGYVEAMAVAGECFLVRVAGVGGTGSGLGRGTLAIAAAIVDCFTVDPVASTDGLQKSRYIGIQPWEIAGYAAGINPWTMRVEIVDIDDALGRDEREGEVWWVGPRVLMNNVPNAPLRGAPLECTPTPHSEVWPSGDLHLFGGALVPNSTYRLSTCNEFGDCCSPGSLFNSAAWGDVVSPFGGVGQPNFGDITAILDKFKGFAIAPDIVFTDMRSSTGEAVDFVTDFADVTAGVDAFKGESYPFAIPACP